MTPETRLKRAASQMMKTFGIFSYHVLQGLGAYPGIPDRIAHHRGQAIYLEFKAPKGRMSEKQKEFQARCKHDGIRYEVVRSLEDIEDIFELPVFGRKIKRG